MNDPNRMTAVIEVDDSQEEQVAQRHRRRMSTMQTEGERSAAGQGRAFETMHDRLIRQADRMEAKHRSVFATIDRLAQQTASGVGKLADATARTAVKMAEVVGAVALLGASVKTFFGNLRGGELDVGRHEVAVSKLINMYRAARIALAPTLFTAGTLGAGVLAEYAVMQTAAQARQVQADSFTAARSGRSFQNVSTIGMAGVLSGEGRGRFQSVFGEKSPGRIQDLVDQYRELKDPIDQAAFGVKNFGDNAERALPLLRDRLKENIDRASELSAALNGPMRESLAGMREELRAPGERLKELASDFRNLREEAKQKLVFTVIAVHDTIGKAPAPELLLGLPVPPEAPRLPSDLQFAQGALDAARDRQKELQASGTAFPLSQDIVRRSTAALGRFRDDSSLEGLHRRRGEQETRLEADARLLALPAGKGGVAGSALEQNTREDLLRASNELYGLRVQIKAAERVAQEGEAGFRKVQAALEHQTQAQRQATGKMLEGAITNSRAGQFDPSLPSFASEALQSFEVSRFTQGALPYFMLPKRKSQDQIGADLIAEEAQRLAGNRHGNELQVEGLERQGRLNEQLVAIRGTDPRRVSEEQYALRLNRVTQVYEIEKQILGEGLAQESAAQRRDVARIQRTEEIARIEREHFDTIKREATSLFETLFRRPGQFGGQLWSTVQNAVLQPVTNGLGNAAARFLAPIFGGGGLAAPTGGGLPVMPGAGSGIMFDSPSSMIGGAGDWGNGTFIHPGGRGPLASLGGIFGGGGRGWLGGLRSTVYNSGNIYTGPWSGTNAAGIGGIGGTIAGVASSPAAIAAGGMLAQFGLTGSARGTFGGTFMGAAGGALAGFGIGAQIGAIGGPLGAAIGAGAGLLVGLGEQIFGVEPPSRQAHRLIAQIYGIDIPERSGAIQQILALAQQYGSVSSAVRSPQARQLIEMYGLALGRSGPGAFLSSPRGASLVQQGGNLYQGLSYFNGSGYNFQSSLPTLGASSGVIPTFNPYSGGGGGLLQLDGPATTALLSGQVVRTASPEYVGAQSVNALRSGSSRFATMGAIIAPSTIFA